MEIQQQLSKELEVYSREHQLSLKTIQGLLEKWRPSANIASPHLHTFTLNQLKGLHGQEVLIAMMVQDCLEPEIYAGAFVPKRTTNPAVQDIILNKYWPSSQHIEDFAQYDNLLLQREVYHLAPIKGESKWVRSYQQSSGEIMSVLLKAYEGQSFKLGQVLYAACLVDFDEKNKQHREMEAEDPELLYPSHQVPRLHLLKLLTPQEITQSRLNIEDELVSREVSFDHSRQAILNLFTKFSSEAYSHALLYSLIAHSNANLYLSGQNLYPLIEQLLPRAVLVSLRLPLKEKFFPYKEHHIYNTLLQVSEKPTFVVVDFTDIGPGKIAEDEIITLKLLKLFVEDGQLHYRWEYGESLMKIDCSGIVARGSTIIKPTLTAKNQKITLENVPVVAEDELWKFRAYLAHCRKTLGQIDITTDVADKIKNDFLQERQEKGESLTGEMLNHRLLLARLDCASRGNKSVSFESYADAKQLLSQLV